MLNEWTQVTNNEEKLHFFSMPAAFAKCKKVCGFSATISPSTEILFKAATKLATKTLNLNHASRPDPVINEVVTYDSP